MFVLGPVGFTAPYILLALLALPILWFVLRAVPPAPIRRRFPGVALLLGLTDEEVETDRTPWWLLVLRMLAVAAMIFALAGPVLNPRLEERGSGPLLVLLDASWASAQDWSLRMGRVEQALDEAQSDDRVVAIALATDLPDGGAEFLSPADWRARLAGLKPAPYEADERALQNFAESLSGGVATLWLSDGVARDGRDAVLSTLQGKGPVSVFENPRALYALGPTALTEDGVSVDVMRRDATGEAEVTTTAHGPDPAGIERVLASVPVTFQSGEKRSVVHFDLPPELRNRVTRFEVEARRNAASVRLADDSIKRREVGLVTARESREGLELLSQLHYIRAALAGNADVVEGNLTDIIQANPDVIVLADIAQLSEGETGPLIDWLSDGGLLLRFSGPRLAASDVARDGDDPLLPVRLRAGGRTIGGAMSWGEPKTLRPFSETSPFYGLAIPDDVTVGAQVLAQPDPDLAERVIATLADGTPLVTRKAAGTGQIVLFHITANAEWSTLPLSGLFVEMLDRLAVTSRAAVPDLGDLAGQMLQPVRQLDGFGRLSDATSQAPIAGEDFAMAIASAQTPPGLYRGVDAAIALNVIAPDRELIATDWPADVVVQGVQSRAERPLLPHLLIIALGLLALDLVASLFLSGRLSGPRLAILVTGFALMAMPPPAQAQSGDDLAVVAAADVVLAHVLTGDADVDRIAQAGLVGLSQTLAARTSVEPSPPMGINLDADPLGFFPLLYWPVTADQRIPSAQAYAKLNAYLRTGGMIIFDTRDADIAGFGATTTPTATRLEQLARPLDVPQLEPIPQDHVLTRAFYLLQEFPGRHTGGTIWVEAAPADAEQVDGMPFRNLNDNVTPVIVGGNDWAAAWAVDDSGWPLLPVGRGFNGERQREIAARFGVNLVMYVLTGNYKSDQVHVPALLDRLSQ
ncbi:DUF4159 domain-containing protein [Celeribacter arenosi]|uniref:DUF4159 domain-containing protein n=1 Tax=Celeribacter arenosi TaxID=792649 RepID=A0ABP7K6D6_9RHOB